MEHWYSVHTKPRKEYTVHQLLEGRGIESYLPVLPSAPAPGNGERRGQPFFARYLFVRLDPQVVPLSAVNWTPGVQHLVSFGGQPAVVQDAVIHWLKARLAQAGRQGYFQGAPLQPNDRLRVTSGPLEGMEAVFDRHLSAEGRAQVFVELVGRLVSCRIDLRCLERI